MEIDDRVDILEVAGAHEVGTARDLLLGGPERDRDRAGNVVPLHHLLDGERGQRRDTAVRVVAFHVAGTILHQRLALIGAGRLRTAGQGVDLGDDGDLRPAAAILGPQIGRHVGPAQLHLEAGRGQGVLEQFRALEFLHPELAEVEQRVADVGHLLGVALDHIECKLLALIGTRGAGNRNNEGQRQNGPAPATAALALHVMLPRADTKPRGRNRRASNGTSAPSERQDRARTFNRAGESGTATAPARR